MHSYSEVAHDATWKPRGPLHRHGQALLRRRQYRRRARLRHPARPTTASAEASDANEAEGWCSFSLLDRSPVSRLSQGALGLVADFA